MKAGTLKWPIPNTLLCPPRPRKQIFTMEKSSFLQQKLLDDCFPSVASVKKEKDGKKQPKNKNEKNKKDEKKTTKQKMNKMKDEKNRNANSSTRFLASHAQSLTISNISMFFSQKCEFSQKKPNNPFWRDLVFQ